MGLLIAAGSSVRADGPNGQPTINVPAHSTKPESAKPEPAKTESAKTESPLTADELKTVAPRPERAVNDARLERAVDELGDAVERARAAHDEILALPQNRGKRAVDVVEVIKDAQLERVHDIQANKRAQSARADAHLARLMDRKGDLQERRAAESDRFEKSVQNLARRDIRLGNNELIADHQQTKQQADQQQQQQDQKDQNKQKDGSQDAQAEKRAEIEEERRQERADERRERRDDIQRERNDDRSVAKPGAGAAASGP